jgi:glycosyltransferase involved in cell wall biosynthesis
VAGEQRVQSLADSRERRWELTPAGARAATKRTPEAEAPVSYTPPKVVFVLSSYVVGGAERQLAALIANRPARTSGLRLETITFLPTGSPELAETFEALGVTNTLVNREALRFPAFLTRLVRVLRASRPDIVHTILDSSTGAWGRLAALLAGVRSIMHSDRSLMTQGTRAHFLLRPYLDRATARFLPNAEAIAERLVRSGVPRDKITVVPSGVDLTRFDPEHTASQRSAWGVPEHAVVAGFLGRFAAVKRLDVLLDAITSLSPDERPDHVVLAGNGPMTPQVEARVDSDPWLAEHCRLLGTVHDVTGFLASIDYLVLPSEIEGLPNVVLEAMAMRRPVVATRVSDVPTLLGDTGFLADPGEVASLREALRQMQSLTPAAREALGRRARARVEQRYDLRVVAERFWQAHLDLLPPAKRDGLGAPRA